MIMEKHTIIVLQQKVWCVMLPKYHNLRLKLKNQPTRILLLT